MKTADSAFGCLTKWYTQLVMTLHHRETLLFGGPSYQYMCVCLQMCICTEQISLAHTHNIVMYTWVYILSARCAVGAFKGQVSKYVLSSSTRKFLHLLLMRIISTWKTKKVLKYFLKLCGSLIVGNELGKSVFASTALHLNAYNLVCKSTF